MEPYFKIALLAVAAMGFGGLSLAEGEPPPTSTTAPSQAKSFGLEQIGVVKGAVTGLAVEDSRLYAAGYDGSVRVFDIGQPADPKLLGSFSTHTAPVKPWFGAPKTSIAVHKQAAHIICNIIGAQYQSIDFSDPSKATRTFKYDYANNGHPVDIA